MLETKFSRVNESLKLVPSRDLRSDVPPSKEVVKNDEDCYKSF